MFRRILLSIAFLFSISVAFSQTDTGEKMHVKVIRVSNSIYMLQANGGNISLSVGNNGIFMVDDQFAEGIEKIQKEIKKIKDKPIQFLVNTHFHGDHVGGNTALAQTGAIIISQENVRPRLMTILENSKVKISKESLPIITFDEDITFHYNNEKIYVFHIPNAHTDGDAMVYFTKNNVLSTGDVFFNGKYPYIDTENGGSILGVISGLKKTMQTINEDTKIIPGHGNLGTYKDLQKTVEMLGNVYKMVAMLYVQKKTEDEVAKMTDITEPYDSLGFGKGYVTTEAFLRMVYKEVAKERSDIETNAEKNRKAREKVKKMMAENKADQNTSTANPPKKTDLPKGSNDVD